MQSAHRVELDRLVKEGIITEVKEHTEWINSIIPVMKSNGCLRLCLDPKDSKKQSKGVSDIQSIQVSQAQVQNSERCNLRLLACSLRLGKQSTHHIQHTLGQI